MISEWDKTGLKQYSGRVHTEFIMFWIRASGRAPVDKVTNIQLPYKVEMFK